MIIKSQQGVVEVTGGSQEFKTSIDPKNLEFITTLLSSNLYSNPEQSFIREIVSNAWDSHVEAGTTDIPVIIKIKDKINNPTSITIRDFGTGLSPERFSEVYRNMGSSTKRESNDYIGCFGIGHLSPFACSDSVYITSYYNGKAYYYIGTKVGNTITYHLLRTVDTEEKNGVEITISNLPGRVVYEKALYSIIFFPNVYIDCDYSSVAREINNLKIKRGKYYAAVSINCDSKILLGNVLYPLDVTILNSEARWVYNKFDYSGIVAKFDVGELNVTPNRENIIYTKETIDIINQRLIDLDKELQDLWRPLLDKDYDDIVDYFYAVSGRTYYEVFNNTINPTSCNGYCINSDEIKATFKGEDKRDDIPVLRTLFYNVEIPNYKGVIVDDKIYVRRLPYRYDRYNCVGKVKNILVLPFKTRLTNVVKNYLYKNYNGYTIINPFKAEDLSAAIAKCVPYNQCGLYIVAGIYNHLYKISKYHEIERDPDFIKYKESCKKKKVKVVVNEDTILWKVNPAGFKSKYTYNNIDGAIEGIKALKGGVILTDTKAPYGILRQIANSKGYTYIQANKNTVKAIKERNLKCIVDEDWLMYKDPLLSIIKSIIKYYPKGHDNLGYTGELINRLLVNLDKDLRKEIVRLDYINRVYCSSLVYRSITNKDIIKEDEYTKNLCLKLKDLCKKQYEAELITETIGGKDPVLIAAVLMKNKSFRISGDAYKKVKNNKLIRILCRK